MKQAVMTEPGKIIFNEVDVPSIGSGQIKVKMKIIGVCGSDIHVYHGKHPYTSYPVVQGHEVSAEVVEAAPDVKSFKPGDRVTIQPQVVCGRCYPCTHGMYNVCESLKVMGFQTTGMASDFFVVDAAKVLKFPSDMSFEHGAMIEPLAVAIHAVKRFTGIEGKSALILGGGTIGNLVAQTCKAMWAGKVLITEPSVYRLEIAEKCGISAINPLQKDLAEVIHETFGVDGADVIFECVGKSQTVNQAINYARKGSHIIVVGVFPDSCAINIGFVQDRELNIIGTSMYREEDYITAIRLAGEKKIVFDALISERVPFQDYARAYKIIDEQYDKVMKVLITME